MRDRLIELIASKVCDDYSPSCDEYVPHSCEKCYANSCRIGEIADHLLASGVIVPPCKVGDKVYFVGRVSDSIPDFIYGDTITKIGVITRGIIYEKGIDFADIGKTVFLTREEAEQALKGETING